MNSNPSLEKIWQEKDPETQERLGREYRRMLLGALVVAEQFRQEGREIRDIIHHLDRLEKWMVTTFAPSAPPETKNLSDDEERRIGHIITGDTGTAISDVLSVAASSRTKMLEALVQQSSQPSSIKLPHGVKVRRIDGVLIPPKGEGPTKHGGSAEFQKGTVPRLEMLLDLLHSEGVIMPELDVVEGETPEKSMRYMPYWYIEIPGIQKQVLVCDQKGEATHVVHGNMPLHELLSHNKEDLLKMESPKVEVVEYWSHRSWKAKMSRVLFEDEKREKMQQATVAEIKQRYTVEKWIEMSVLQKRDLMVGEKKYSRIASDLGAPLVDKNMSQETHLELAAVIYGEEDPVLAPHIARMRARVEKERELGDDSEAWRQAIQKEYTYEQWIAFTPEERIQFEFFGKTLHSLSSLFNTRSSNTNPAVSRWEFLKLTRFIFDLSEEGKDELENQIQQLEKAEELRNNPEKLKEKIKEKYTSAEWVKMIYDVYSKLNIEGLGIDRIASVFGVPKVSPGSRMVFMQLGAAIYGEDDEHIASAMKELESLNDPEKIKVELRKRYTAEQWAKMEVPEKKKLNLFGVGLLGIGVILGHKGLPVSYHKDHLKIGTLIYEPEDVETYIRPELDKSLKREELGDDQDKWRSEIMKQYTREQWARMGSTERRNINVHGKRLTGIATIFGADNKVLSSNDIYQKLTNTIFGKEDSQ